MRSAMAGCSRRFSRRRPSSASSRCWRLVPPRICARSTPRRARAPSPMGRRPRRPASVPQPAARSTSSSRSRADGARQRRHAGDPLQDRLLRPWLRREDDERRADPRRGARRGEGRAAVDRDRDRADTLLRLPPTRPGRDRGLQGTVPRVHRAWSAAVRADAGGRANRRRRHRLRGRLRARPLQGEPPVAPGDEPHPRRAGASARQDAVGDPVQQARPGRRGADPGARGTPEPPPGAVRRGGRQRRHRRHAHAARDLEADRRATLTPGGPVRALISVYDKTGVVDLARGLAELGFELLSTGGTRAELQVAGLAVRDVAEVTGWPEMLGGRVKTLHPAIHAGLLARRDNPDDMVQLRDQGVEPIDLLVSNLYPFLEALGDPNATHADVVEKIDVGGPAMLRAASKNYAHVVVLTDPADYGPVLAALRNGGVDATLRRRLAAKAFQHLAAYDTHVAGYLRGTEPEFPDELTFALRKRQELRYGENPHQRAALYVQTPALYERATVAGGRLLHGKELSYLNLNDINAALAAVRDFAAPCAAIIKHANPCGIACAERLEDAYRRALAADPMSAYGGAVAVNRPLDVAPAELIAAHPIDDMVA